jgi:hypothetical protein
METISLESFNTNLHGCRILCQGPFPKGKNPPIMESIQKLREPFKRKILLSNMAFSMSKYLPLSYEAVFHVKDAQDWSMILTYLTYAPKPLLVVSEDITLPDGLWQKLPQHTTFVNITSASVIQLRPYDAIFFAPMEELATPYADYIYKALQSVYKANYTQKEHKEILQELRIAGAGIAWCKEDQKGSAVYWYDPVAVRQGDKLTSAQLSDLFQFLAEQFQ